MGLNNVKLRRGLAGLVAGLIAAIALLVIALPVMMQYQQHITKSYYIKEYAAMLEEQKKIEEKGLSACFDKDEGIISINNSLGRPIRIVMAYAPGCKPYFNKTGYEIKPGPNRIPLSKFFETTQAVTTIKLVTSSGATIQIPYCREVVTVENITLEGQILDILLGEEKIPEGLTEWNRGKSSELFAHGLITLEAEGNLILIRGTLVPTPEKKARRGRGTGGTPLAFRIDMDVEKPNIELVIERTDIGDYLVMILENKSSYTYGESDIGCYGISCHVFSERNSTIYVFGYSYVSMYDDSSDEGPLKYTLINNGYSYLIVGVELYSENTGVYTGEIYVSKVKDGSDSPIAWFRIDKTRKTIEAYVYTYNGREDAVAFYRTYKENNPIPSIDQFAILVFVESLLGVNPGDTVWIKTVVTYCSSGGECSPPDESEWIEFTYYPLRLIVNKIRMEYFGR